MSFEYVLAVSFGIGVAGFIYQLANAPVPSLVSRVTSWQPQGRGVPVRFSPKVLLNRLGSVLSAPNKSKLDRALFELPEVIDLLVVHLRAGDGIYRSFAAVIPRCEGELAKEFSRVLLEVDYGAAFSQQIKSVATNLPQPQVIEFTNKVVLALERGTPLARMLSDLSDSTRAEIRNRLIQQAGKNETRMLIPLVFLILPITVLFAIYPSLELLNFGFI
jgi:tight adherence protein C